MESFIRNFIRSSLVWFGVGILLGLGIAWWPAEHLAYRPAHGHAHLLGFVSMMIFGVAYHVIPRFAGSVLRSRRLAFIHLWVANIGLAGMVGGWILRVWVPWGTALLGIGGGLTANRRLPLHLQHLDDAGAGAADGPGGDRGAARSAARDDAAGGAAPESGLEAGEALTAAGARGVRGGFGSSASPNTARLKTKIGTAVVPAH